MKWAQTRIGPAAADVLAGALARRQAAPCARAIPFCDPLALLAHAGSDSPVCLLESQAGPEDLARYTIFAAQPRLLVEGRLTDSRIHAGGRWRCVDANALDLLDAVLERERVPPIRAGGATLPFAGGAIGAISYDASRWLEDRPTPAPDDLPTPLLWFGLFDAAIVQDQRRRCAWLVAAPGCPAGHALEALARAARERIPVSLPPASVDLAALRFGLDRTTYENGVARALDHIFAGDLFEVCLSQRFELPLHGDPLGLYAALRRASPAPMAAYLRLGPRLALVSSSPERLLSRIADRVETRPIKGTVRRGASCREDATAARGLRADPKQRAEHLMIVDLARSDLARVCRPGSVEVAQHARVESTPQLHHLVSIVRGRLAPGVTRSALLAAVFPGGSITGAPKLRAMQLIDRLEPVARGLYTGSLGYLSRCGRIDLNIAIRTFIAHAGRLYGQVGGAVVADSDPAAEYQETLDKAAGMLEALRALAPGTGAPARSPRPPARRSLAPPASENPSA